MGRITPPQLSQARASGAFASLAGDQVVGGVKSFTDNMAGPRIVTLIGGQPDESPSTEGVAGATITADTVNYKIGAQGWKLSVTGSNVSALSLDPPATQDPLIIPPASAIGAWVYVEDATKVTNIAIQLTSDSGLTHTWSGDASVSGISLVNGWNLLRFRAFANANRTNWGTIYRVRILAAHNASSSITVGHMWAECPAKASLIIIDDGCYQSFVDNAYPDLLERGLPMTWAAIPAGLGTGLYITEARLLELAAENGNAVNCHSWEGSAGTPHSAMTADQIKADVMKCIKWAERLGIHRGRTFKPAWYQNSAPQAAAARPFYLGMVTGASGASAVEAWPPADRYAMRRYALHGVSEATMNTLFTDLEATHGLLVAYTHGINPAGGSDMTQAQWDYFIGKVDAALDAGWLEGVTFDTLLARGGGAVRQGFGLPTADYVTNEGVPSSAILP